MCTNRSRFPRASRRRPRHSTNNSASPIRGHPGRHQGRADGHAGAAAADGHRPRRRPLLRRRESVASTSAYVWLPSTAAAATWWASTTTPTSCGQSRRATVTGVRTRSIAAGASSSGWSPSPTRRIASWPAARFVCRTWRAENLFAPADPAPAWQYRPFMRLTRTSKTGLLIRTPPNWPPSTGRGLRLNHPEAVAVITDHLPEGGAAMVGASRS